MGGGTRVRQKGEKIFSEITGNPYYTAIFSIYMFTALYFSMGTEARSGPSSFTVYILATVIALLLAVNEARKEGGDFSAFIRVLGFDQPMNGYNYLLTVTGVGIAIWAYQFATSILAVAPGNSMVTSAAFPLYNPYTAFPNEAAVSLSLVNISGVVLYHVLIVAPNEEIWVFTMTKNLANWLAENRYITNPFFAIGAAIIMARAIWTSWHWFSWEGLTIVSIITGIAYGIIFYVPNLVADVTGILTPQDPVNLRKILLPPAISAHGTWNALVTLGGLGLGFSGNMLLGGLLIVGSFIGMYAIRSYKGP